MQNNKIIIATDPHLERITQSSKCFIYVSIYDTADKVVKSEMAPSVHESHYSWWHF